MVIRKNDMPVKKGQMRNGDGEIGQMVIVPQDKMIHARLFNKLTIAKDCSIGFHDHNNEVEYYYILSGEGVVKETDGEYAVCPGDMVITGWGAGHTIRNNKDEDLELIAVISTEA